ncbi:hypothetical protein PC129_g21516 [Phytophthora cactorum]|uniref:Uncharacterized protein n=1 Tax=Phytophthora cactorum TaxID=29920 RepID=A0A8T1AGV4_9STRA|nr:hypothetical protein Pcac1_g8612 [Phytophthora cactorum]KAG2793806.1 hypothetical protein PC111_g22880 [Phytophthora cactorum]KAG2796634.1 hypothetical protein PC112_g22117 [Phytophthora cactorum]KAG2824357.1 hypothetical protein PC113_g22048 [Phytophthora cactorum]KAG2875588.1 hypothetical protein PC114_g24631 [Phytophthora cactorum]
MARKRGCVPQEDAGAAPEPELRSKNFKAIWPSFKAKGGR